MSYAIYVNKYYTSSNIFPPCEKSLSNNGALILTCTFHLYTWLTLIQHILIRVHLYRSVHYITSYSIHGHLWVRESLSKKGGKETFINVNRMTYRSMLGPK